MICYIMRFHHQLKIITINLIGTISPLHPTLSDDPEISKPLIKLMETVAFKRACRYGMAPYRYGRIMVTGKYSDGKTSLIQALLGKPIPEAHIPTDGLDAQYSCKVDITKCTEDWSEILIEKKNMVDDRIAAAIITHAQKKQASARNTDVQIDKNTSDDKPSFAEDLKPSSEDRKHIPDTDMETPELIQEVDKELYDRVNKEKGDKPQGKPEDRAIIFMWDFGGQKVYTNLHPIFLRTDCVQTEKLENTLHKEEWKNYSEEIEFWLQMIQSNYRRPIECEQVPNVLLVGTHKDMLQGENAGEREKQAEKLVQSLRERLTGKQYKYLIANYFHVDSKSGVKGDPESFRKLKECLIKAIKVCPTWETERPVPYMRLLGKLYEQEEKPEYAIMRYEDVMKYAEEYNIRSQDDVKQFLTFHHATGDLTYFSDHEMGNYVIVNAQWLFSVFTKLITFDEYFKDDLQDINNQRALDKLRTDGLVMKSGSLLSDLWRGFLHWAHDERNAQKDYLTQLMCKFDLMMDHGEQNYVIPCLLKEPADLEQLEATKPTIYLQFHATKESQEEFLDGETLLDHFLPPALFHQLICRLATCRVIIWKRDPTLSQQSRFAFQKGSQKILLASQSTWIRLSLNDKTHAAEILGQLRVQLDQLLMNCYCNVWYEFCVNPCQGTPKGTLECITSTGHGSIDDIDINLIDVTCATHRSSLKASEYSFWFVQKNVGAATKAG